MLDGLDPRSAAVVIVNSPRDLLLFLDRRGGKSFHLCPSQVKQWKQEVMVSCTKSADVRQKPVLEDKPSIWKHLHAPSHQRFGSLRKNWILNIIQSPSPPTPGEEMFEFAIGIRCFLSPPEVAFLENLESGTNHMPINDAKDATRLHSTSND
ncbi:hypothetical protein DNTS_026207 [Danionella cerebrum]|uniref:Uncharacterized protein n=1 Tax=Danionella cerebrum TaxID=2873325 RepID=A0A553R0G7_9TELE|nr:hypothetical protein DNTS_026207 [Danionella translucida]